MEYTELQKIFYKSKTDPSADYEKVYAARYNSEFAVHFDFPISTDTKTHKPYNAFFIVTPEILSLISQILQDDKTLQFITHSLPKAAVIQYTDSCLVNEIKQTNEIEGIHSTRREIAEVLNMNAEDGKHKRLYSITQKYRLLLNPESSSAVPTTCREIRTLYDELVLKDVLKDDPENQPDGEIFRKGNVSVIDPSGKALHHGVETEKKIISYMETALKELNDENINFLIRTAVFHYMFGFIHPFYDGNGRTSRFLSSLMLSNFLEPLVSLNLSYIIKDNQNDYYKAFENTNSVLNRGDLTPFITIFLEFIKKDVNVLNDDLTSKQEQLKFYRNRQETLEKSNPAFSNKKADDVFYILLQSTLFGETGISVEDLAFCSECSSSTVRKILSQFPPELFRLSKNGRKKLYDLNLDFLKNID